MARWRCGILGILTVLAAIGFRLGTRTSIPVTGVETALASAPNVSSEVDNTYNGLDVLFLIDQSGSMGGKKYGNLDHPIPNDPLDLRFYAPSFAIDWLAQERILYFSQSVANQDPRVKDLALRVAVVYFGSTTKDHSSTVNQLPPTDLSAESVEQWKPQQDQIHHALAADAFKGRNLDNTDFQEAFNQAKKIFADWSQGSTGRHLKAMIVITDGGPEIGKPFDPKNYMKNLVTYSQTTFPSTSDYTLYTIALNDSQDNYWPIFGGYWDTITSHQARLVTSNRDVGSYLEDILNNLMKQLGFPIGLPWSCGIEYVPPYLQELGLDVHKSDPAQRPVIYENNVPLEKIGLPRVEFRGATEPIEQIFVQQPQPGQWRTECPAGSSAQVHIFERQQIGVEPSISGSGSQAYAGLPLQVVVDLVDRNGTPIKEYSDPKYRLNVRLTMRGPQTPPNSGIPVDLTKQSDGVYAGTFTPEPGVAATYTAAVNVSTQDPQGNSLTLVDRDIKSVEVRTLSIRQTGPTSPWTQYSNQHLAFQVLDNKGEIVPIKATGTYELGGQLELMPRGGSPISIPLAAQSNDTLMATFRPTIAAPHDASVKVSATLPGGQIDLLDQKLAPLSVTAVTLVRIGVVYPVDGLREIGQDIWGHPTDFKVEAQLSDETGRLLDASQVFEPSPGTPVVLTVTGPGGATLPSTTVALRPSGTAGSYTGESSAVGDLGRYVVLVRIVGTLNSGYALDVEQRQASLTRVENPLRVELISLLVVVGGAILSWLLSRLVIRTGPQLHGSIIIRDTAFHVRHTEYLDGHRRSHSTTLGIPVLTGVRELHTRQLDKAGEVFVNVRRTDGERQAQAMGCPTGFMALPNGNTVNYICNAAPNPGTLERMPALPIWVCLFPLVAALGWAIYHFAQSTLQLPI